LQVTKAMVNASTHKKKINSFVKIAEK